MSANYTIEEANALIPEVARRMTELAELHRAAAERLAQGRRRARGNGHGGGLDRETAGGLQEALQWFEERDLRVRGTSPPLVDFPAVYGGREVLLCWTEGEERIGWYHLTDEGFAGRRPVGEIAG